MTILVLGGTAEARSLARALVDDGLPLVSSLAGRVAAPALPVGEVRIGGFGGPEGLRRFLEQRQITAVVDATHPFAAQMSRHAVLAATAVGCPLLRLARPGWSDHPDASRWTWVADAAAAVVAGASARRPFLTTGRQSLESFLPWADRQALVRVVELPTFVLPEPWRVVRSRGPYAYPTECGLMEEHRVDLLVTKDSGGSYTQAKLAVAADLGVPVVVIRRPAETAETPSAATVTEARAWLRRVSSPGSPA